MHSHGSFQVRLRRRSRCGGIAALVEGWLEHILQQLNFQLARHVDHREDVGLLHSILHVGGISVTGLATLLEKAADVGTASRNELRHASAELYNRYCKTLKVPCDGGHFDWEILDLASVLPALLDKSPGLRSIYAAAISRCPPSRANPWSMIVTFDEFCPGNKLQADCRQSTCKLWCRLLAA